MVEITNIFGEIEKSILPKNNKSSTKKQLKKN